ncbi:DUF4198 domain-containing protein [Thalassococcus lentus]|uniref:DUF4198 domain-containing protein n=1 Tax=Thalassococcus lentus TaxID=1210524 RepID=A0ABT4XX21_9RHOB|nr:DUF4198 domain-containing protein [Thalassococcus lentus]MDA7426509.1 DUF4198 domain-containing protein [Thalassococcus lentus]
MTNALKRSLVGVVVAFSVFASSAAAHEFWIDPLDFQIDADEQIEANIRVGENFEGAGYAFVPPNFQRFELVFGDALIDVEGRAGDRPALSMQAPGAGLITVVHVTRDYTLTYREWEKFQNFAKHKDFVSAIAKHEARGLPQTGFKERYSRHAKSLIAVGDGAGADRELGLVAEIVALSNPYTDDLANGLKVKVLYEGTARGQAQVELFERAPDGEVAISLHTTDDEGVVFLPVKADHVYLADHVVLRAIEPETEGAPVWESLWASLTFEVRK